MNNKPYHKQHSHHNTSHSSTHVSHASQESQSRHNQDSYRVGLSASTRPHPSSQNRPQPPQQRPNHPSTPNAQPTSQNSNTTFAQLHIIESLQRALTKEKYVTPTPIQAKAIPHLLEGKDLIGIAQTGTGKTAAFVLPILQKLQPKPAIPKTPRVLVLAPTRELAAQIGQSFATYGQFMRFRHTTIFGGVSYGPQIKDLSRGVDILIATPGRLLDLLKQHHVNLRAIEFFVLDEADRMLDMGFINDIKKVVILLPQKRQSLFFSATMPPLVAELARKLLTNPIQVAVTPQATTVERIEQRVFFVDQQNKDALLLDLLKQSNLTCVLIFTRTKHKANKVAVMLNKNRIYADAIHGNKTQNQRTKALHDFKTGRIQVLVATDIAARGIDIDNISHVINYELPNEAESYVHRIGRTARAGAEGTAYSFCAADERMFLRNIERLTRMQIQHVDHQFHSEAAKNSQERPPPRGGGFRGHSGGNRRHNQGNTGRSQDQHGGYGKPRFNKFRR
ncbi:DEAD/DEAH box helicase [Candidatus Woesearchaeota archaeon]|nr:DEAD/DEAH box helicase [Candidatus Woesearchaeota archaeon]